MIVDDFRSVIEISSLDNYIRQHLDEIDSQEKRITHLKKLKSNALEGKENFSGKIDELKAVINKDESTLYEREKQLEKSIEHQNQVTDENQKIKVEQEIAEVSPKIEALQEAILDSMEKLEELELEYNKCDELLSGIDSSISKISDEVGKIVEKENGKIQGYEKRIQNLAKTIKNPALYETFRAIRKKYRFQKPICFLNGNHCGICRYEVAKTSVESIEYGRTIEACPNCSRLFVPLNAR